MTIALSTSLHVDRLLPSLCPSEELNGIKLCDDGFGDSPASLQLSRTLSMSIVRGTGTEAKRVSQRALDDMGLTVRQAWDSAALNLQRRALTEQGLRFFTRPAELGFMGAEAGLEVRAHRCTISSWLAHPQAFVILDNHLQRLSQARSIRYLVPDAHTLYALFNVSPHRATELAWRAAELRPRHRAPLSMQPLVLANGFPLEV